MTGTILIVSELFRYIFLEMLLTFFLMLRCCKNKDLPFQRPVETALDEALLGWSEERKHCNQNSSFRTYFIELEKSEIASSFWIIKECYGQL